MINTYKTKNTHLGYTVKLIYQITAHHSEEPLLRAIKLFFKGVGNIEFTADKQYVSYRVYKLSRGVPRSPSFPFPDPLLEGASSPLRGKEVWGTGKSLPHRPLYYI